MQNRIRGKKYNVERIHTQVLGVTTKYIPATPIKGARIKATVEGYGSVTVPYGYIKTNIQQHYDAACDLIDKKFSQDRFEPKYTGSYLDAKSGYVFVFKLFSGL